MKPIAVFFMLHLSCIWAIYGRGRPLRLLMSRVGLLEKLRLEEVGRVLLVYKKILKMEFKLNL